VEKAENPNKKHPNYSEMTMNSVTNLRSSLLRFHYLQYQKSFSESHSLGQSRHEMGHLGIKEGHPKQ
jgi:hypothetical protein